MKGMTQVALARKSGLPQSTVHSIEKRRAGHPRNILALCKALGMRISDLIVS